MLEKILSAIKTKNLKVRIEYDSRMDAIRIYVTQELPGNEKKRRGLERCWSLCNVNGMVEAAQIDFLKCEIEMILGAFEC